jgi:nucleotide-binding universal stress UspA family protein
MKAKPAQKQGTVTLEPERHNDQLLEDGTSATSNILSLNLKRLLVALDFSPCSLNALDYAFGFAEKFEANLILLHVVEPTVYPDNYMLLPQAAEEINQNLVRTARERLESLYKKRPQPRPAVEFLVRLGHAHSEIPDTAQAMGADLIIIGTHGHTALRQVLVGSIAERVVRQTACPVLTVPHSSSPLESR